MSGIDFGPGDVLYAYSRDPGAGGRGELYTIDQTTGDTTTGMTTFLGFIGPFNAGNGIGEYESGDIAIAKGDCTTTTYCNPGDGGTNNTATISISGCALVAGVTVDLANGPPGQFSYLLIGDGNSVVNQPPGSKGDLCVVGGNCLGRYGKDVGSISSAGTISTDISSSNSGGPNFGIPTCGGNIQSGETWYFQYWHRQPMGQPSTFSEAICVLFN